MDDSVECWHFSNGWLGYGDVRLIEVGAVHTVSGKPKCCVNGLHGSIRAIDALRYAKGQIISRVIISNDIHSQSDKLCGGRREYLAVADAEKELRSFARWCALQVVHLWDAPSVVKEYLQTGDESLRAAAWAAAEAAGSWAAAGAAGWDAARAAGWDAAWAAAGAAGWDAARAAGWAATEAATEAAAWAAAEAAGWDAAWAAAGAAGWDAARAAAGPAGWAAAEAAQNTELDSRLRKLLGITNG